MTATRIHLATIALGATLLGCVVPAQVPKPGIARPTVVAMVSASSSGWLPVQVPASVSP